MTEKPISTLRVLIVDDHFLTRQLVHSTLLEAQVTNVQSAKDGNEAIDLIQGAFDARQPYDIVFLDWHMPKISGLEVLSHFRAKPEYANKAFVMLTADAERKNIMKAATSGATAYIIKPVSSATLTKKLVEIHGWLEHRNQGSLKTL